MDLDVKVPQVIFVRHSADSGDSTQKKKTSATQVRPGWQKAAAWRGARFGHQPFCFLHDALWEGHLGVTFAVLRNDTVWYDAKMKIKRVGVWRPRADNSN